MRFLPVYIFSITPYSVFPGSSMSSMMPGRVAVEGVANLQQDRRGDVVSLAEFGDGDDTVIRTVRQLIFL